MRGLYGYLPLLVVLLAGLALAIFVRPITTWIKTNRAISIGAVVGHITHVEGSVRRLHGRDIDLLPINQDKPIEVRDGDTVQTGLVSKADFTLEGDGGRFEIPQGSGILFQRWQALMDGSPLYLRVLFGSLNGSAEGEHYVVKGEKLYFAGQTETGAALGVSVSPTKSLPTRKLASLPPRASDDKLNPQTLSNEYVNARVEAEGKALEACLAKTGEKVARAMVQFEISRAGTTRDVKISTASPSAEPFKACVEQVFAGIRFRPFTGADFHAEFPLQVE